MSDTPHAAPTPATGAWQDRALCAQIDPELFFPEKGHNVAPVKRLCLSCEVRTECLEYAITSDERFGVWGGKTEREIRRLRRERGLGRRRKAAA